jgi:cell division protein FtsB
VRNIVDFLTIWLALSGIIYAVFHQLHLSTQNEKIEDQLTQLGKMGNSLSTQGESMKEQLTQLDQIKGFISTQRKGVFPEYVEEIARLAGKATKSLDIMADCVDYGSFFAPDKHRKAHAATIAAIPRTDYNVRILVCGPPEALSGSSGMSMSVELYLRKYEDLRARFFDAWFDAMERDPNFKPWVSSLGEEANPDFDNLQKWLRDWHTKDLDRDLLKSWVKASGHALETRQLEKSREGANVFRTLLQARQKRFLDALHIVGAEIRHLGSPLTNRDASNSSSIGAAQPLFLWIRDLERGDGHGQEGVFGFSSPTQGTRQSGFLTSDRELLTTFQNIFDERWKLGHRWQG